MEYPPFWTISSINSILRAAAYTVYPFSSKRRATSKPMPLEAPVIKATFFISTSVKLI